MASIRKHKSGWRVEVFRNGIRRSKVCQTKAEATAWAVQAETEILNDKRGEHGDKTVADLLVRYRAEIATTHRGEAFEARRIKAMLELPFARLRLDEVDARHMAAWRDERLKAVSAGTVLRDWTLLSAAFSVALREWQWVKVNPMTVIKRPPTPASRTRRISADEIERLGYALGYAEDEPITTLMQRVAVAFLLAIETALRAGELVALAWSRVDLERRTLFLPLTKNGHSRTVPLSSEALRLLGRLPREGEAVLGLQSSQLDALFRKAKSRALIEDLHFHDTRREALSRLAAKVDVMTLAKISGHRDLKILLNTYYATDMADVARQLG